MVPFVFLLALTAAPQPRVPRNPSRSNHLRRFHMVAWWIPVLVSVSAIAFLIVSFFIAQCVRKQMQQKQLEERDATRRALAELRQKSHRAAAPEESRKATGGVVSRGQRHIFDDVVAANGAITAFPASPPPCEKAGPHHDVERLAHPGDGRAPLAAKGSHAMETANDSELQEDDEADAADPPVAPEEEEITRTHSWSRARVPQAILDKERDKREVEILASLHDNELQRYDAARSGQRRNSRVRTKPLDAAVVPPMATLSLEHTMLTEANVNELARGQGTRRGGAVLSIGARTATSCSSFRMDGRNSVASEGTAGCRRLVPAAATGSLSVRDVAATHRSDLVISAAAPPA